MLLRWNSGLGKALNQTEVKAIAFATFGTFGALRDFPCCFSGWLEFASSSALPLQAISICNGLTLLSHNKGAKSSPILHVQHPHILD